MNSSLVSEHSVNSQAFKSRSQARPQRGNGRIKNNNMSELASYLQDGLNYENTSKLSYSRYEVLSNSQSKDNLDRMGRLHN